MRIEAELFGSPVQFPKGFKACLVEAMGLATPPASSTVESRFAAVPRRCASTAIP
jgi:hypothetical protein